MGIIETLRARDAYHGALRHMVENGTVFQMNDVGNRVPVPGAVQENENERAVTALAIGGKDAS